MFLDHLAINGQTIVTLAILSSYKVMRFQTLK